MIWLPESPRWLLTRERYEEGERVIAALRGLEIDDKETQLQKQIIMDSIKASGYAGRKGTPLKAVFTGGKTQHFRRMMLGVSSQFMQQVGGCNAIIYYFPILFEQSIGQSHNISLLLGGVNMIVYAIFATVSWFIIERVGRRKLFLWGTVGQCLSMVIVFSCLIPGTGAAAKGAAVGLFTYIASFGASWLPLPWVGSHRLGKSCIKLTLHSYTQLRSTQSRPDRRRMPSRPAQIGFSTSVSPSQHSRSPLSGQFKCLTLIPSHRNDNPNNDHQHPLGHLSLLRRRKRLLPPSDLLHIPRNRQTLARGNRHHLRQGLRREYRIRESGTGAGVFDG